MLNLLMVLWFCAQVNFQYCTSCLKKRRLIQQIDSKILLLGKVINLEYGVFESQKRM
jgi:hypothetical protein